MSHTAIVRMNSFTPKQEPVSLLANPRGPNSSWTKKNAGARSRHCAAEPEHCQPLWADTHPPKPHGSSLPGPFFYFHAGLRGCTAYAAGAKAALSAEVRRVDPGCLSALRQDVGICAVGGLCGSCCKGDPTVPVLIRVDSTATRILLVATPLDCL